MPSLFSRARTTSTANNRQQQVAQLTGDADEFGRVSSRTSNKGVASLTSKKDAKRADKARARTVSTPKGKGTVSVTEDEEPVIPDGSFFPLNLDPPRRLEGAEREREQDYGYLSFQRHVILGLEEVDRLVRVLTEELGNRGLTTPFIFSSLALDVSTSGVRRLVQAFLRTCVPFPAPDAESAWRDETRFAGPHELGMCLRWGLARVVRVMGGHAVRGLVPWESYAEWSESEVARGYPPTYFGAFLAPLQPVLRSIILNVMTLLTRFTAHSASSGHTPPTLSPLFGPLLFGLGHAALAFHHTYIHYLRATNAMEHLLLAFIRWQDAPSNESSNSFGGQGSAASLGVPTRLKDWIRGYPAMLPEPATRTKKQDHLKPRRGARTVRVVSVRRNVRMYTPDLVKSASSWAARGQPGGLIGSREWERVAPPTLKLPPRYADNYKKRMDLAPNFHPQLGAGTVNSVSSSSTSSASSGEDYFGLGKGAIGGEERFRSLTDLKWGEFEALGFGGLDSNEKKLQFDLTEGARTARAAKRTTLSWNDFSSSGFSRMDAPLNATLQFSTPVANTISTWPQDQAEIQRKLKKTQQSLPPFGWDTEPVMGTEEIIEESFIDVFCDLVYGGGWMDLEREEDVDRECNWALVEYKSLPVAKSTASGGQDPRISTTLFLFEEFVPLEYRQQLSAGVQSKRRLASFFSPNKAKQWKPAATLNGRPYVVGHVPKSPTYREVEFEGLLRSNQSATKIISFDRSGTVKKTAATASNDAPPRSSSLTADTTAASQRLNPISPPLFLSPRADTPTQARAPSPSTPTGASKTKSRFRLPAGLPLSPSRTSGLIPSQYENVDFETRLASYSDDELNSGKNGRPTTKEERRRSKDDAWVDILVANHSRRMGGQDAELRKAGGRAPKVGQTDPEIASLEVAQVLAGVRAHPLSDDEEADIEPMNVPHRSALGDGVDEETELAYAATDPGEGHGESREEPPMVVDSDVDESEEEHTPVPITRRRMGYFDLHPDRRPPAAPRTSEDDDPRERLARDSEDSAEVSYEKSGASLRSPTDDDFEPAELSSLNIDMPEFQLPDRQYPENGSKAKKESLTLTGLIDTQGERLRPTIETKPGKTAALIEMYRERERMANTTPVTPSPPTRTPQRSPALLAKEEAPLPPPPAPSPSPPASLAPEPEADFMEPPRFDFEASGRESPYRYVHGAPLHNVVEEEEEEWMSNQAKSLRNSVASRPEF
ncbi:hypothetical protein BV25DRAFT_1819719 [Artomyces pyxidatus]|uniref:Uncharacterized protein n=1 Tax=Artomyces pyxidatus TaxID=48021 RepID=A0ACB8TG73_9AGAM|nr:hypothetical protein BV25DRAFT_1819719 [Artomyces pyxidatus]